VRWRTDQRKETVQFCRYIIRPAIAIEAQT
jgi:hypothetical protein